MKKINLHEAQENLPELIELALQGKEIVICMAGMPLVKLIPFQAKTKLRKPGS